VYKKIKAFLTLKKNLFRDCCLVYLAIIVNVIVFSVFISSCRVSVFVMCITVMVRVSESIAIAASLWIGMSVISAVSACSVLEERLLHLRFSLLRFLHIHGRGFNILQYLP